MSLPLSNSRTPTPTLAARNVQRVADTPEVFPATSDVFAPLDRRIQVVVMMLETNSHKQIVTEEIARLVNLSPSRLAHLFKHEMELSIQQYVTQLRLAKARDQLESSFLSVKEIAASVGFSSVTRFVVCFKDMIGATPAQYRKRLPHTSYKSARRTSQQDPQSDSRNRN